MLANGAKTSAMTPEEKAKRRQEEDEHRSLTHAAIVACGINPHQAAVVFNRHVPIRKSLIQLESQEVNVCGKTTMRADLEAAEAIVVAELRAMLVNVKGSIITDGASFRHDKAVAIVFSSTALDCPRPAPECYLGTL